MSVPTRGRRKRVRVEVTLSRKLVNGEGFLPLEEGQTFYGRRVGGDADRDHQSTTNPREIATTAFVTICKRFYVMNVVLRSTHEIVSH
jgi:hypothetical protein